MTSDQSPEVLLGIAVVPRMLDPMLGCLRCSACRRRLANDQRQCACGATFAVPEPQPSDWAPATEARHAAQADAHFGRRRRAA